MIGDIFGTILVAFILSTLMAGVAVLFYVIWRGFVIMISDLFGDKEKL